MKKKIAVFVICLAIGLAGFQAGRMVEAGSSEPGSQSDPLITKSYLDERLSGVSGGMTPVTLSKGQTVYLSDGAIVLLYKGNASIASGSLINMSEGSVFGSGNSLVMYNSFLSAGETSVSAKGSVTLYVGGACSVR